MNKLRKLKILLSYSAPDPLILMEKLEARIHTSHTTLEIKGA